MILDDICAKKKERLIQLKKDYPLDFIKEKALNFPTQYAHYSLIEKFQNQPFTIIGELKKASPSKGLLRSNFNYQEVGKLYESKGIGAISILTEEDFFLGKSSYLTEMKSLVSIPLLRKDFIIDPYQIYESVLIGADAILLIARILSKEKLTEFKQLADQLKLDVLLEVHSKEEIEKVQSITSVKFPLIGINNRDLDTFEVDLKNSQKLIEYLPKESLKVSESGIQTFDDIKCLKEWGFKGALIGEAFMKAGAVEAVLEDLNR